MPEVSMQTASGDELTVSTITVKMYRKYCELMEKADAMKDKSDVVFIDEQIIREVFGNRVSSRDIEKADAGEIFTAAKTIHYIMQEIVTPKFLDLMSEKDKQEIEAQEKSAFDEYDEAEGYDDDDPPRSVWSVCKENIDRVTKLSIRAFNNSLAQCMESDIMSLLDYVKFELETTNEK